MIQIAGVIFGDPPQFHLFLQRDRSGRPAALRPRGYVGRGWKFSKSEAMIKGPAPQLGEANEYVLGELLGIEPPQLKAFADNWTIGTRPEGGRAPGAVPLEEQVELGWIAEYDASYLDHLPPV